LIPQTSTSAIAKVCQSFPNRLTCSIKALQIAVSGNNDGR